MFRFIFHRWQNLFLSFVWTVFTGNIKAIRTKQSPKSNFGWRMVKFSLHICLCLMPDNNNCVIVMPVKCLHGKADIERERLHVVRSTVAWNMYANNFFDPHTTYSTWITFVGWRLSLVTRVIWWYWRYQPKELWLWKTVHDSWFMSSGEWSQCRLNCIHGLLNEKCASRFTKRKIWMNILKMEARAYFLL